MHNFLMYTEEGNISNFWVAGSVDELLIWLGQYYCIVYSDHARDSQVKS
jgi:hypothetical protein